MIILNKRNIILKYLILFFILFNITACSYIENFVYKTEISIERFRSGFKLKALDISDHKITYLESGKGEVILLVHGYTADKDIWIRFARLLKDEYRIIVPDLPGHGDSTANMNCNYSISSQAKYLKEFIDRLGIEKLNIVGNSMGGSISLNFTHLYQNNVKSMALFNSGGVKAPNPSEFNKLIQKGINPFIIKNKNDFKKLIDMSMSSPPFLPWPIKSVMYRNYKSKSNIFQKIYNDISNDLWETKNFLPNITIPVFILWGDNDRLIDVSCVEVFDKNISNSQAVILENIGHCPMIENPKEAVKYYKNFLSSIH